jgi:carbamoyl-phosphate synthase small subunit
LSSSHTDSAILVLEDGSVFKGVSVGASRAALGEVVFNTSMTGYQEILTDPSYKKQIVTLTYPHIGNVGCNDADHESLVAQASGLVIKEMPLFESNFRSQISLGEWLSKYDVPAIANIDTRRLTRILREKGSLAGFIAPAAEDESDLRAQLSAFPGLAGMDLAREVTCANSYEWNEGEWALGDNQAAKVEASRHVVAYDFGVKRNILRMLVSRGCKVTVVPATTPVENVIALRPDGVFLSNGPGDPEPCDYAISAIRRLLELKIPLFGICLGHQLLALASGARTQKMKFGHHGANHPVKDLGTEQVLITSQNHGFQVDENSLPDNVKATHVSLFDGSLQGIERTDVPAFSFQGHPEASPGPHDVSYLFDRFISEIDRARTN